MNALVPVPAWDGPGESLAALQQGAQFAAMNRVPLIVAVLAFGLGWTSPALAANGQSIPEPSTWALLAMGAAGLIIGRRGAKRPPEE